MPEDTNAESELLNSIADLAESLALEHAEVDDYDLPTCYEAIGRLTAAQQLLRQHQHDCPDAVSQVLKRYAQAVL